MNMQDIQKLNIQARLDLKYEIIIKTKWEDDRLKIDRKEKKDDERLSSEIDQFENKGKLKRFVDTMNLMVALIVSLLTDFLKFDFSNNVLKTEVSFCAKIIRSIEHILFKRVCLWNV